MAGVVLLLALAADPVGEAADAALAPGADLKALAARDDPDPWLVADELCARGRFDEAARFAGAAPRPDLEGLPEYVRSRRGKSPDAEARRILAALGPDRPAESLAAAERTRAEDDPVVAIRLGCARGLFLDQLGRRGEGARAFLEAGRAAYSLGWLARASRALQQAGQMEADRFEHGAALEVWNELVGVEERRRSRRGRIVALGGIGTAQGALGRVPEARASLEQAVRLGEEEGDRQLLAACLTNLGAVHSSTGDYAAALACHERAMGMQEELEDRAGLAASLANIGLLRFSKADYAGALACHERSLALLRALGDRGGAAGALVNIGMVHEARGDLAAARDSFECGLAEAEAAGQREFAAIALANLGSLHQVLGDHPAALACAERALARREELGDRYGIARSLVGIGIIRKALGEYGEARALFDRALRMQEELGDRPGIAATLGSIGVLHEALGDYARALECQERALALSGELSDRAAVAQGLLRLGVLHHSLGDDPRALDFYGRALEAAVAIGRKRTAASAAIGLGMVHASFAEPGIALSYDERALELFEELGDRSGVATALGNIGVRKSALGAFAEAFDCHERSLRIREEIGDRAGVARTLSNLGFLRLRAGDPGSALSFQERAVAGAEAVGSREILARALEGVSWCRLALGRPAEAAAAARRAVGILGQLSLGLAEEEGARTRERFADLFDAGTLAALALGDPAEFCFFVESGRAATLLELLEGGDALRAAAVPEGLRMQEAAARAEESIALARHGNALAAGDRDRIREARRRLDAARERIAEAILRIQRHSKAVAAAVHPEVDSLETLRGRLREGETLLLFAFCAEEAAALVLTRERAEVVPLGKVRAIEDACAGGAARGARALRGLVVDPLRLPEGGRVLVSPAGVLAGVPFSLLLEGREVVYLPSGTTFGLLLDEAGRRGDGVLALGDPDRTLPAGREEATALGDVALLGSDASESNLSAALASRRRWRALHFACHGSIDPERPRLSALRLGGGGLLTTLEVFRLRAPADLVVLSACETASGRVYRAEGVVGFVRAFLFAGAPRVIVSLWKVDDEATKALMVRFYRLWKEGTPCARALLESQRFVASHERWKDPHFWAAWQLWGLPD